MGTQHYLIGDHVHVSKRSFSGPMSTDEFEILAQYPVEGDEPMYRVRSLRVRTERVVPQSELRRGSNRLRHAH